MVVGRNGLVFDAAEAEIGLRRYIVSWGSFRGGRGRCRSVPATLDKLG